jgi:hypothetical protein
MQYGACVLWRLQEIPTEAGYGTSWRTLPKTCSAGSPKGAEPRGSSLWGLAFEQGVEDRLKWVRGDLGSMSENRVFGKAS